MMLFGYPVEMLCTYQYSLVSLMPGECHLMPQRKKLMCSCAGLLMNLCDSGAPELDLKPPRLRPTSLRSSDRGSLLKYMGLREF